MDIKYEIQNSESDRLPLIFMPAPFMTTTREVFRPAISQMKNEHPIVLLEPPGFGQNSDVKLDRRDMKPSTYISFIASFLHHVYKKDFRDQKLGLVASGHSGCYSLEVVNNNAHLFDKVLLANPGFKGPFPHVKEMMALKGKQNMIPYADKLFNLFWYLYVTPGLG